MEGHVLVDDVRFTKAEYEMLIGNGTLDRYAIEHMKWPNRTIPYTIDPWSKWSEQEKKWILHGIAYVNEQLKGCLEIRLV